MRYSLNTPGTAADCGVMPSAAAAFISGCHPERSRGIYFVVAALLFLTPLASAGGAAGSPTTSGSSRVASTGPQQNASPQQNQPPPATAAPATHGLHSITVTFDYDFSRTPACTEKVVDHCVARFVVYDISAGYKHRAKLFSFPAPDGAKGPTRGVTFSSPKLDFESGKHQLAVAAQEPSGVESPNFAATVWVVIP